MRHSGLGTTAMMRFSLLLALASALHAVESFLPALGALPGAKLGLANIITLLALASFPDSLVWRLVVLRVLIGSLIGGTLLTVTFFLSATGAVGSTAVMIAARKLSGTPFSIVGLSILGATAHNLSQLLTAALIVKSWGVFFYLPYLLMFALPSGCFIGYTAKFSARALSASRLWDGLEMTLIDRT